MSPVSNGCPSREALSEFIQGDTAVSPDFEDHIESCRSCQNTLDELARQTSLDFGRDGSSWVPGAELLRRVESEPAPPAPLPTIRGYRVVSRLGQGGMGVVYEAVQEALGRAVALKTLRADKVTDELRSRFRREVEVVARLNHPHIVHIFEVGDWQLPTGESLPYLAMELVRGVPLSQWALGKAQPAEVAAGLVEKLARAVHAAHEAGIVHRDLKPANVLVSAERGTRSAELNDSQFRAPSSEFRVVKITDFGLAKPVDADTKVTETGDVLGTPSYMAPEQVRGQAKDIGPAADVYALGAILYELLTTRPPFVGKAPMEILLQVISAEPLPVRRLVPTVPRELETVCLKCLEKEPGRRYATALELAEDLRSFQHHEPIRARPVSPLGRALKWAKRKPVVAGLAAAVVVAVVIAVATLFWSYVEISASLIATKTAKDNEAKAADVARQKRDEALAETLRALFSETRMLRLAHPSGWRERALANLKRIAQMKSSFHDVMALRNEAVACLTEMDVVEVTFINRNVEKGYPLVSLDLSADGKLLAGTDHGGHLHAWDVPSGKPRSLPMRLARLADGGRMGAQCVGLVPGTMILACGERTRTLTFHDWITGAEVYPPITGTGIPMEMMFDALGTHVATSWDDGTVTVHEIATGIVQTQVATTSGVGKSHPRFALSPNCEYLGVVGRTGEILVYQVGRKEAPIRLSDSVPSTVHIGFSPGGNLLATAVGQGTITIWDVRSRKPVRTLHGHDGQVFKVAFSPDGTLLASSGIDRTLRLWDVRLGEQVRKLSPGRLAGLVSFSADGEYLCLGEWSAKVYRIVKPAERRELGNHGLIALHPTTPTLATASSEGIALWDLAKGREPQRWLNRRLPKDDGMIHRVEFSPQGDRLAVGFRSVKGGSPPIELWDAATGAWQASLEAGGKPGTFGSLAFDSTGRRLVESRDSKVLVWDLANLSPLRSIQLSSNIRARVAVPVNKGTQVLIAYDNGYLSLQEAAAPHSVKEIKFAEAVSQLVVSRDERHALAFLSTLPPQLIALPELRVGGELKPGPNDFLLSAAFHPDNRFLVTGSFGRELTIWDAETLEPVCRFPDGPRGILKVAMSRDGKYLVAQSSHITIYDLQLIRSFLGELGLDWAKP